MGQNSQKEAVIASQSADWLAMTVLLFGHFVFLRQPRFCGAICFYSAGGVHRSLLPPEELLPPLSGAGVVTRGVWRRVVEAA